MGKKRKWKTRRASKPAPAQLRIPLTYCLACRGAASINLAAEHPPPKSTTALLPVCAHCANYYKGLTGDTGRNQFTKNLESELAWRLRT